MDRGEVVVVTGFGAFREFLVNPSWTAAQGLKSVGLGEWTVYVKELPVSYVKTQQIITEIWKTIKPKLAVHLGVARGSGVIILEQSGKNCHYRDKDVCGFCPESHCCVQGGPDQLDSVIDMRAVARRFQRAGVDVVYSRDAGGYLCDFAYYLSLYHGQRRAALIHVPSGGGPASAHRLVPLLQSIIQTALCQLDSSQTA
ncbi:pyroglutamyl-peptidase 1 isoform X1 [Betta splendens]|uniref:Pyroglutamyl-peptidase 1 isoform X1 n=1 Tax=Betta splendens TaxID=158456 RepID=A0A6P7MSC4_BETSP|nr:pyroglutamyl-peptidase 1 isoform X1 [Betta splendens]